MESITNASCGDNASDGTWYKEVVRSSLSTVSMAVCSVAVALFFLYKLHRYFNYRLILYLLVANMLHSTVEALQLPFLWIQVSSKAPDTAGSIYCMGMAFLEEYSGLVLLLCVAFICAEIFVMVVCYSELSKVEVPCVALCIVLPVLVSAVPFTTNTYGFSNGVCWIEQNKASSSRSLGQVEQYALWYGPAIAIGICCMFCTVAAIVFITCHSFRNRVMDGSASDHLEIPLQISLQGKYISALKETLPFMIYPITVLIVSLAEISSVLYTECTLSGSSTELAPIAVGIVADVSSGCVGMLCASAFFIHLHILGKEKRLKLRCGKRTKRGITVTSYGTINREESITAAGSITGTHPTIFEPPGESEVDRSRTI